MFCIYHFFFNLTRLYFTSFSSSLTFLAFCLDLVFSCSISALSSLFFLDSSTILVAATSPANPARPKQPDEDEEVAWRAAPCKKWSRYYYTCQCYLIFLTFLLQTSNLKIFVAHKFEKTTVYILQLPHLVQQVLNQPTREFGQRFNGAKDVG